MTHGQQYRTAAALAPHLVRLSPRHAVIGAGLAALENHPADRDLRALMVASLGGYVAALVELAEVSASAADALFRELDRLARPICGQGRQP